MKLKFYFLFLGQHAWVQLENTIQKLTLFKLTFILELPSDTCLTNTFIFIWIFWFILLLLPHLECTLKINHSCIGGYLHFFANFVSLMFQLTKSDFNIDLKFHNGHEICPSLMLIALIFDLKSKSMSANLWTSVRFNRYFTFYNADLCIC